MEEVKLQTKSSPIIEEEDVGGPADAPNANKSLCNSSISSLDEAEQAKFLATMKHRLEHLEKLRLKFVEAIETRDRYPIVKEYKSKNCFVRRRPMNERTGIDLFILERDDFGMTPGAYMDFQVSIKEFCKANRLVSHVEVVEAIADNGYLRNFEVYAMYVKSPTFLISDRLFFDSKYILKDEAMVLVSSEGYEKERDEYFAKNDTRKYEHAVNNISAMKFFPIFDPVDKEKIIGTKTIFVNESDFGGSIPKWLVQKFVPKSIHELFDDVVITTKKMNGLIP